MLNKTPIKVLLVDVDNTLIDFNKCARIAMSKGFEEHGLEYKEEYFPTFIKINEGLWKDLEKGIITKAELLRIRWTKVFNAIGVEGDGEAFEHTFLARLRECGEPVDGAHELLKYLDGKYQMYVASNAPYDQQASRLRNAGMLGYFKDLFISERIGHQKPTVEFFEAVFRQLEGVTKEEVVLIGDSLSADITGGERYGIKTIWFNYKKESLPAHLHPTYVVDDLLEIKNIL
ncbi:MAG: YjjG family noncanonical pyrimidine nucleotidase [Clostridia bacterium]|nr:YjjG family noncanonical pyrimidine nucleotidase [Clostridia bacterium]